MTDEQLRELFAATRSIAVVGIKARPTDDAFEVPLYMQQHGYRILPVNPKLQTVLGEPAVASLADVETTVDLVNLFRATQHIPAHTDEILAMSHRPLAVWMQLGISDPASAARLQEAGIDVVEDRCLLVEHQRMQGAV